ncbi:hypothetical protein [Allosaccharopolyspora coralli]|uniref:hypothetical protein n=1 Tax=Allosaccharopolyspora coralli TaxID=2665642 RepID=UPI001652902B|nr:hypothetical protein [Allosaccharopolyspora coralli]
MVVTVGAVVLLCGAAVLWWLPLAGQQRAERPVAELMKPGNPALPGPWSRSDTAADSSDSEGTRSWVGPDRAEIDQTIRRYASPVWSSWAFSRADPVSEHGEYFDAIVERRPPRPLTSAEQERFFCGQIHGRPGACDNWWVQLRYGQYVVNIQSIDVPSSDAGEIPPWLAEFVREADRSMAEGG